MLQHKETALAILAKGRLSTTQQTFDRCHIGRVNFYYTTNILKMVSKMVRIEY
ncbi:hypothetical protein QY95_00940 [Bacillus thermotolerans]|uniref:Uncharacterized protein n=1 Tax=Bacillus thermotolerans TaxID=1221996 RepID=A0A0F5I711_BACTR|nr:hypothetical protein QY95_00940 [Bacillus thermotolerans]